MMMIMGCNIYIKYAIPQQSYLHILKLHVAGQAQGLTAIILPAWEAEIGASQLEANPDKKLKRLELK
jgi:hypothetical protein